MEAQRPIAHAPRVSLLAVAKKRRVASRAEAEVNGLGAVKVEVDSAGGVAGVAGAARSDFMGVSGVMEGSEVVGSLSWAESELSAIVARIS